MRDLKATTRLTNEVAREFFFWPRELREIYITLPAHGTDVESACKSLDFDYPMVKTMVEADAKRSHELDDGSRAFTQMCTDWATWDRKYPNNQDGRLNVEELERLHFSLLAQVTNIRRVHKGDERVLKDIFKVPDLSQPEQEEEPDDDSGLADWAAD